MSGTEIAEFSHSAEFRRRRFLNWFPMGLTYAFLYMGRYNLTVAKGALGDLMTKEDFGIIFAAGTTVYALAFLLNGPLVDRLGGRKGILAAAIGASLANLLMGAYLFHVTGSGNPEEQPLRLVFSILYALNMYFQSFGAVSIVKVNAHWFHVRERGGFSGIFGTMISSGIFLAFTVNQWFLDAAKVIFKDAPSQWVVFLMPGLLLLVMFFVEFGLLRDRPGLAGHQDFDTGDASSGDDDDKPVPAWELIKRILTNKIILMVAFIEFCTGVLRNGVMHWFPIYAQEVWALPDHHPLRYGSWENLWVIGACFAVAAISGFIASRARGARRGYLVIFGGLAFLAPFVQGGWGGLLFIAGVIGGNVAGWVSDLFFQSRRAPAAAGMYGLLALFSIGMIFTLAPAHNTVGNADEKTLLRAGDEIQSIGDRTGFDGWAQVQDAIACYRPVCVKSTWDAKSCMCTTGKSASGDAAESTGVIPVVVKRDGAELKLDVPDPKSKQRAGDRRRIKASPELPMSPYFLGALVFLLSLCVIGIHGLLSGTATMDFGGRKGAGTAVGVIDGFVYLGTALQSISLGYITSRNWQYWPVFLVPFAILGFILCTRIWSAKPSGKPAH
ncbi:MAG: MFS transporter [Polyangiaceae bacterium]